MKVFPVFSALLGILVTVIGLELDVNSKSSIQKATSLIAKGLLDYYEGTKYGGTIGMFSWPYYWWEAGGAWGSLIDYTYYTENDTLVPIIKQALTYQTGEDDNYIPLNQSTTEGNDDQGFWGIAVMAAAEKNFSNPSDPKKAWLTLAQAVFNTMSARWDTKDCGGGLRWQIFQWNSGYDYKNTVSTGCLFNIAARLARYTGNDSYSDWAEKIWEWFDSVGLLAVLGDSYYIYDGVEAKACDNITKYQWTYNQGLLLAGCAFLYNYTEDEVWHNRTKSLLKGSRVFFQNDTMYEAACQPANTCSQDQRSFKAYFSRFLGLTAVMAPETSDTIMTWLTASAKAAAASCSGGTDGHTCGTNWFKNSWDGNFGLGEQMCALEVIQNLRIHDLPPPYTAHDGGSSIGNPSAGYSVTTTNASPLKLDGGDKAGAAIITIVISASLIGSGIWLIL